MSKHLNPLEKEFLIRQYKSNTRIKISDFCEANHISTGAFQKWIKQYDEGGLEGLARADSELKDVLPEGIDRTEESYLDIFKRLFITDNQPPSSAGIRSSVRVKQAEKRHFSDPSLACALLKATPARLLGDLETLGFLFEALCERDLRIYAESFGASLYHYQDYKSQEIDAVIELSDGQWCAFEIKLGANQIDAAAVNLLEIKNQITDDAKGKPPAVLCVLCGMANAAYQRPDGVFVVPITALKN